ncbi:RDD family protein [Corynebacteriaceae bacterium 7-707]
MTNPFDPNNPSQGRPENTGGADSTGGLPSYGDYVSGGAGGAGYDPNFGYGQTQDPGYPVPGDSYPGAGRRLGAYLIDAVLFFFVMAVIMGFFLVPDFLDWVDDYSAWLDAGQVGAEPELAMGKIYLLGVLSVVLWFIYRVLMETSKGRTVGKMALGMKVVDADGRTISAKDSFIRNSWYLAITVAGMIPFVGTFATIGIYAALGVLIARDPHRQHLCDSWAKAYVVYGR